MKCNLQPKKIFYFTVVCLFGVQTTQRLRQLNRSHNSADGLYNCQTSRQIAVTGASARGDIGPGKGLKLVSKCQSVTIQPSTCFGCPSSCLKVKLSEPLSCLTGRAVSTVELSEQSRCLTLMNDIWGQGSLFREAMKGNEAEEILGQHNGTLGLEILSFVALY